jgi:hypothetical protein
MRFPSARPFRGGRRLVDRRRGRFRDRRGRSSAIGAGVTDTGGSAPGAGAATEPRSVAGAAGAGAMRRAAGGGAERECGSGAAAGLAALRARRSRVAGRAAPVPASALPSAASGEAGSLPEARVLTTGSEACGAD